MSLISSAPEMLGIGTQNGTDIEREKPLADRKQPLIDAADDPARGIDWLLSTVGPRTLMLLDPSGHHKPLGFYLDETTRDIAISFLRSHNNDRVKMNCYFHVNPTPPGFKTKAAEADIAAIEVVGQGDIDVKGGRTWEDCWAAVCALSQRPSFTIMTGGGFQIGYILTEPLPPTNENKAWAVAVNQKVRELTGGDPVQDISRIFRLPFTVNWPSESKQREGRVPTPSGLIGGAL
jgi:hypothetical protein